MSDPTDPIDSGNGMVNLASRILKEHGWPAVVVGLMIFGMVSLWGWFTPKADMLIDGHVRTMDTIQKQMGKQTDILSELNDHEQQQEKLINTNAELLRESHKKLDALLDKK